VSPWGRYDNDLLGKALLRHNDSRNKIGIRTQKERRVISVVDGVHDQRHSELHVRHLLLRLRPAMAARRATLALAVTEETKARLLRLGTKRVELFSAMGMDAAAYARLCAIPIGRGGAVRFISMGRLLHWKGFHLGLRAFAAANLPDAEYWIVGDGPERPKLVELATRLRIANRVRFCGPQRWNDALQTLATCHVLVHPSLHDSGGFVCLEAMATGKPVLCLDLGGPAEQVTPLTGVKVAALTPEQAVSDLARAMTLLGNTPDLRHAMGEEGRRRVKSEYIWDTKGDRLDAMYESVLDQETRRR